MEYTYKTKGTCSSIIKFDVTDGIIRNLRFNGGCEGNTKALSSVLEGMPAEFVIERCGGIKCGHRPTSCGDQLAKALKHALKMEDSEK